MADPTGDYASYTDGTCSVGCYRGFLRGGGSSVWVGIWIYLIGVVGMPNKQEQENKRWYIIHAYSGQEDRVRKNLEQH